MAWTAPPTFVSGTGLTAAQLNILGANLLETAPAKASGTGQYFCSTGVNSIAARTLAAANVSTNETTAATTNVDLATVGPSVSIVCGTGAFATVLINALISNSISGATSSISFDLSGATTLAAGPVYLSLTTGSAGQTVTMGGVRTVIGMTGGTNTFKMMYAVGSGTGTFGRRHLTVLPFG